MPLWQRPRHFAKSKYLIGKITVTTPIYTDSCNFTLSSGIFGKIFRIYVTLVLWLFLFDYGLDLWMQTMTSIDFVVLEFVQNTNIITTVRPFVLPWLVVGTLTIAHKRQLSLWHWNYCCWSVGLSVGNLNLNLFRFRFLTTSLWWRVNGVEWSEVGGWYRSKVKLVSCPICSLMVFGSATCSSV